MVYIIITVVILYLNAVGAKNYQTRVLQRKPIIDEDSFAFWWLTAILSILGSDVVITHLMLTL